MGIAHPVVRLLQGSRRAPAMPPKNSWKPTTLIFTSTHIRDLDKSYQRAFEHQKRVTMLPQRRTLDAVVLRSHHAFLPFDPIQETSARVLDKGEESLDVPDRLVGLPVEELTPQFACSFAPLLGEGATQSYRSRWNKAASYQHAFTETRQIARPRTTTKRQQLLSSRRGIKNRQVIHHANIAIRGAARAERRSRTMKVSVGVLALDSKQRHSTPYALSRNLSTSSQLWRPHDQVSTNIVERTALLGRSAIAEAVSEGLSVIRRTSSTTGVASTTRRCGNYIVMTKSSDRDACYSREHWRAAALSTKAIHDYAYLERLRFEIRFASVAAVLVALEGSQHRRPAQGRILELSRQLNTTAGENPDPSTISREQFVHVTRSLLSRLSKLNANMLFSSFDLHATDRVRCGAIVTALLAARGLEATKLELHIDDVGETSPEVRYVMPLIRKAVDAYDPKHDGIQVDTVHDLLTIFATSYKQISSMTALLRRHSHLDAGTTRLSANDIIQALRHAPDLSSELQRQVQEYRKRVKTCYTEQLVALNTIISTANRHCRVLT